MSEGGIIRKVYILRHADWDTSTDTLTDEGKQKCLELKSELDHFDIVICSPFDRNKETARLLTDSQPAVDQRAGILELTDDQNAKITEIRQSHPLGVAGAIFSIPELIGPVRDAGQRLIELTKEIIPKLPEDGRALIISHDGTMVAAEKIMKEEGFESLDKTYHELEGFVLDENLKLSEF